MRFGYDSGAGRALIQSHTCANTRSCRAFATDRLPPLGQAFLLAALGAVGDILSFSVSGFYGS
jgi:hypothetical protein